MNDSKTCGCFMCRMYKYWHGKHGGKQYQENVNFARRRIRRKEKLMLKNNPDEFMHPTTWIGYFA